MKRQPSSPPRSGQPALQRIERFQDRAEAGRVLAQLLSPYDKRPDVIVLGLPRGGVPVAYEIAQALSVPLDVLVVRKLPTPGQPELAMGAVALGDVVVLNREVMRELHISDDVLQAAVAEQQRELRQRERRYREARGALNVRNQVVILVDDGLATGSTMRAAISALSQQRPAKIIVAVPVSSAWVARSLRQQVDDVLCPLMPEPFYAIGEWYDDFSAVSDEEVRRLLDAAAAAERQRASAAEDEQYLSKR